MPKSLTRYWLHLGVAALAIAGIFSLVLVIARTPQLAALPLFARLFHEALVVHVDLSVLVWFLAIACLLWSRASAHKILPFPFIEEAALFCFALGMAGIALSPFDPNGEAFMSNYIPVIFSPVFFLGLALVGCGVALMVIKALLALSPRTHFALWSAALITALALGAFAWSFHLVPPIITGAQYYELTFWGGGHILQFTHTQVMMVCWLMVASAIVIPAHAEISLSSSLAEKEIPAFAGMTKKLFAIGLLAALISPMAHLRYDVTSGEFRAFFTHLMIVANGIAPCILALLVAKPLWKNRGRNALWATLAMSILLFLYGGLLGGMIQGQNVVIPAHYHGSVVGVTLAFMAVAYLLLPEFGYADVLRWRMAFWQPILYASGQLMHITGLAYSGGYGVLRKTPSGTSEELAPAVKAALGFMGLGGLLAIIGGLLFVVVIIKAMRHADSR